LFDQLQYLLNNSATLLAKRWQEKRGSQSLAGDTSYTEQLMLEQVVDGVSPNEQAARQTLKRIYEYVRMVPTVYLPSHDPEAKERLSQRQTILFPETINTAP
jgi:hypothetical protein